MSIFSIGFFFFLLLLGPGEFFLWCNVLPPRFVTMVIGRTKNLGIGSASCLPH